MYSIIAYTPYNIYTPLEFKDINRKTIPSKTNKNNTLVIYISNLLSFTITNIIL